MPCGGLYVKQNLMADAFHKDANSIYRVSVKVRDYFMTGTPYLFAETIQAEQVEVKETLRTADRDLAFKINNEIQKHKVLFADSNFLTFFTFPLQYGNRQKALSGLKQVVLSHEMAEKYFPNENPLGQVIKLELENTFSDFEITGVTNPTPNYSSIYFDFLIPLENKYVSNQKEKNDWGMFFVTTFIKVKDDIKPVEDAMPGFITRHLPREKQANAENNFNFKFLSYADHHLSEGYSGGGMRDGKSRDSLMTFSAIASIILLLACFNFMNLTNAQSSRRAVEVGIKKVVGALKPQLIKQFLTEALVLSFMAAFIALGLAELSLFLFRDLLQTSLSVFDPGNWDIFLGMIAITFFAGVLGGIYPAFILSNLNTLATFKKYFKIGGSNWMTRSILSLQFMMSIVLIVCAIVMWKQQTYMMEKDLGYNQEQVLVVKVNQKDTSSADFLKNEIKKYSEVLAVSRTSHAFTQGASVAHHVLPDNKSMFIYMMSVDTDFIPTMEMQIVKGEGFSDGYPERGSEIMVNEALVRELGLKDSIGIKLGSRLGFVDKPKIVGVVKDFHHDMLKREIKPLMFLNNYKLEGTFLMIRLAPEQTLQGLKKVQALVERTNPNSIFEYSFLDDNVTKQYEAELRWSTIITLATAMAIFLSVLGLLGLAMFTAEQRKKEIGIRKVLGASLAQLVSLLSKGYLLLIAIAFALAVPVSYYLMNEYWLNNFAYKISLDVVIYIIALLVVLCIAGVSIGSQTVRAALQNPADTLKEE
jgi:putative ABC transport system permease protein